MMDNLQNHLVHQFSWILHLSSLRIWWCCQIASGKIKSDCQYDHIQYKENSPFFTETTLRKIDGTKMVSLGHRLMVRKTEPFGALFWCPFAKGHWFCLSFLLKRAPFFKTVPKGHCSGSAFFLSELFWSEKMACYRSICKVSLKEE